tara:strand:- start:324 stop:941 length:618 start_codon:yes stop_codon:yes gene_type:complete
MSSLATEQTDFKMLRFYDHGMNNAQSYQYDADGDLIGDYGEQWILFKGKVEDHGDGRHIHVPPQTAVRWSRLPANENYQQEDEDGFQQDIARFTPKESVAIPGCTIYENNPDPNPPPPGVDPYEYTAVYNPDADVPEGEGNGINETYGVDWTRVEGVSACKDFFQFSLSYETNWRTLDENPEADAAPAIEMGVDEPSFRELTLRF